MEIRERVIESGFMSKLFARLFRSRLTSAISKNPAPDIDEGLIAELKVAKESDSISAVDIAVIDSWIISLEIHKRKIASGRALDRIDLAEIAYIKSRALAVISQ